MIISQVKLKELLKKANITKSYLSNELGISSRTIAKIAKREHISSKVIERIAEYFDVPFDDLIEQNTILDTLKTQMQNRVSGGLYHETQIKLTYNSNHIEGSRLTEAQTRYIFETKTIGELPSNVQIDDIIETNNHFKCIDYIITHALDDLTEQYILTLQRILKEGTEHANIYGAGRYKTLPNVVGGIQTASPKEVDGEMKNLIVWYQSLKNVKFEDIVEFHYRFERIHPFQDGNGRIGRLIAFKQCLENNIVPFYIDDGNKWFYYRGLREWTNERNYLIETCRFGQDQYKMILDYFEIK